MSFFWNCFKARGSVEAYLAVKELEKGEAKNAHSENMFYMERKNVISDIPGDSA